jgi:hypothetical protein
VSVAQALRLIIATGLGIPVLWLVEGLGDFFNLVRRFIPTRNQIPELSGANQSFYHHIQQRLFGHDSMILDLSIRS